MTQPFPRDNDTDGTSCSRWSGRRRRGDWVFRLLFPRSLSPSSSVKHMLPATTKTNDAVEKSNEKEKRCKSQIFARKASLTSDGTSTRQLDHLSRLSLVSSMTQPRISFAGTFSCLEGMLKYDSGCLNQLVHITV